MKYIIIIAVIFLAFQYAGKQSGPTVEAGLGPTERVVLYGTKSCGYCAEARQLLRSRGIAFTDVDIESSTAGRKKFQSLGGGGIPLITVDSEIIRGYDKRRIIKLIGLM